MNINDILLAQNIKRWTIVATKTDQSLAEHLFNVTMIARAICAEAEMDDSKVTKYALDHDLDEIMTGDIPSPAKERLGMKSIYEGKSGIFCTAEERAIVKAADLIDAVLFIKYNHFDRHGRHVMNYTRNKLDKYMAILHIDMPVVYNAVENTIAMLEFGVYDAEVRG